MLRKEGVHEIAEEGVHEIAEEGRSNAQRFITRLTRVTTSWHRSNLREYSVAAVSNSHLQVIL